jgi:tetratricopeptide (TPR) repeat protein
MNQKVALDEYLAQARSFELNARYKDAFGKLSSALSVAPADQELVAKFSRLNLVSQQVPSLNDHKSDPFQSELHQGLLSYLGGDNATAVEKIHTALKLKPNYHDIDLLIAELKRLTGIDPTTASSADTTLSYEAAAALTRANSAIQDGNNEEAIAQSLIVLKADPKNANAWENLGTAYFALNDFDNSLNAWRKALEYEKSPAIRAAIKGYMKSAARAKDRRATLRRAQPLKIAPKASPYTSQERQKIFDAGVDHFTKREFEQAKQAFENLLRADSNDIDAQKALRRVIEEMQ